MIVHRVEVKVQGVAGPALFDDATQRLGAWGGMDHSLGLDDDGFGAVSFDLGTVPTTSATPAARMIDRISTVMDWLSTFDRDNSLTVHRWKE